MRRFRACRVGEFPTNIRLIPRLAGEAELLPVETLKPLKLTAGVAEPVEAEHLPAPVIHAELALELTAEVIKPELPLELAHRTKSLQTLAETLNALELEATVVEPVHALKLPTKLTLELAAELPLELSLELPTKAASALELPTEVSEALELARDPIELPIELPARADDPTSELTLELASEALILPAEALDLAGLTLELTANPGVPAEVAADRREHANPTAAIPLGAAHATAGAARLALPPRVSRTRQRCAGRRAGNRPAQRAEPRAGCLGFQNAREW